MSWFFKLPTQLKIESVFQDLRAAGYTFWYDGLPDSSDYEKQITTYPITSLIIDHPGQIAGYTCKDVGFPDILYEEVLNWRFYGNTPWAPTQAVSTQSSGAQPPAPKPVDLDPFQYTAAQALPKICLNHSAVETGTAKSWCRHCDRDAVWNREKGDWEW